MEIQTRTAKTREELVRTLRGVSVVFNQAAFLAQGGNAEQAQALPALEQIMFVLMWCANIRPSDFAEGNRQAVSMFGNLCPEMEVGTMELNRKASDIAELLDKCAGES
jgi:hypothetical protein